MFSDPGVSAMAVTANKIEKFVKHLAKKFDFDRYYLHTTPSGRVIEIEFITKPWPGMISARELFALIDEMKKIKFRFEEIWADDAAALHIVFTVK